MKLSKVEACKISFEYKLGKVVKLKIIDDGQINTNFLLETDKGKFILRFLRKGADKNYLKERNFEFKILNFLKRNNYPYQIPIPLKNKTGKVISKLKNRNYWVYRYIEGEKIRKLNNDQVKEVAKAISLYHKIVSGIKTPTGARGPSKLEWLIRKYDQMSFVNKRSKLNKTMLKYRDYFQKKLDSVLKIDFSGNTLPVHADFHQNNLVFEDGKLVGVLDFDNLGWSLKQKDLANSMKSVCKGKKLEKRKIEAYLREYKKYNGLTKKEISLIKPLMIRNFCIIFWWAYEGGMKNNKNRAGIIEWAYESMKSLERIEINP